MTGRSEAPTHSPQRVPLPAGSTDAVAPEAATPLRDIVVAYCEWWDTPLRTSKHHYVERLANRGHRVLYVEVPPTPLSIEKRPGEFLTETVPRLHAGAEPVRPNVWAMTGVFLVVPRCRTGCKDIRIRR